MMRERIETAVREVLEAMGLKDVAFVLERPGDLKHGDYATNAALAAGKLLEQVPRQVAEELAEKLKIEGVETIEIAGPGFINFFLSRRALLPGAEDIPQLSAGKTVMVEYTQPNPFKPFHIGHLMSNTLGEAIARLLKRSGAAVIRANYQGDVGPHVAKAIWALQRKGATRPSIEEIGEAYVEGNAQYEASAEAKQEIDAINKKIYERSDESVNALYDYGRALSLEHFEELYRTLGTKFDHYLFESETAKLVLEVIKQHPDVFEVSEGDTV